MVGHLFAGTAIRTPSRLSFQARPDRPRGATRRAAGRRHCAERSKHQEENMANLWARKSIAALKAEAASTDEHGFKRTLTATNLVTLGIGAIIGAGFFVLTGHA